MDLPSLPIVKCPRSISPPRRRGIRRISWRNGCPTSSTARRWGAGHAHQLEVPDQVNLMIDNFMRHYVFAPAYGRRCLRLFSGLRGVSREPNMALEPSAPVVDTCAAAERLAAPWRSDESPSSTCVCATRPLLHPAQPVHAQSAAPSSFTSMSPRGHSHRTAANGQEFSATNNSHPGGPR